jgi:hypothetical protein
VVGEVENQPSSKPLLREGQRQPAPALDAFDRCDVWLARLGAGRFRQPEKSFELRRRWLGLHE